MPKIGVDKMGREWIYELDRTRTDVCQTNIIELPPGSIKLLTGRTMYAREGPVELQLIPGKEKKVKLEKRAYHRRN